MKESNQLLNDLVKVIKIVNYKGLLVKRVGNEYEWANKKFPSLEALDKYLENIDSTINKNGKNN